MEIISLVKRNGTVERGKTGPVVTKGASEITAETVEYNNDDNSYEASIHSHPTKCFFNDDLSYYRFDCEAPSKYDVNLFSKFDFYLIVGKRGELTPEFNMNSVPKIQTGWSDYRPIGVSFYGRNIEVSQKPKLWLSKDAICKILGKK